MRLLSRMIFREILVGSFLGALLFTVVLFLQRSRSLFEILVRTAGTPGTVAEMFALVLPRSLPFTIPLGVLVGTLLTLSRMSTDGEITAMRAAGVPGRRVVPAILAFGFVATWIAAGASMWLTPWSIRKLYDVENEAIAHELTADVEARVFGEQFPNMVLYVTDIITGPTSQWKRIFMADVTPPGDRKPGAADRGDTPRVTLSSSALAVPDVEHNRINLALKNGNTYEVDKDGNYHISGAPAGTQGLEASKPDEVHSTRPAPEMDTRPLYRKAYFDKSQTREDILDERIELHQRLAVPLACILLALAGIPLGVSTRRAGKSAAVVMTVVIAFIYWIGLIGCISLARQGAMRPEIALWLPDIVFFVFAVIMIARLEIPSDFDLVGAIARFFRTLSRAPQQRGARVLDRIGPRAWVWRIPLLPQVIDTYVLTSFMFYFVLLLTSFVLIYHVFTFFELLSDIIKNHPSMSKVLSYHFFLTPRLIYDFTPVGVLAAVLVAFGVLSKHNEITAFKACGISVYRLSVPVLVAGLFLSGSLFAFDHYWVPDADRRQDALRNEIKGKAPQTYLRPDRKWIYGLHDRIYYYKYFDQGERTMLGVDVYEIDPASFRLKRQISAERARWEPALKAWVFQNGQSWLMDANCQDCSPRHVDNFSGGTHTFPELEETPDYFVHEVKQSRQMNFEELEKYIAELQQGGFDTVPLQVQLNKKFSVPLFALILAMVSIPFAFVAGNRGAMAGVGMSFVIFIAYWSVLQVFEQIGNLGQLPPQVAAWSPDVMFGLAGLYFLARMRT
jgi:LPS export ABC transporter permease LptG/LPS export ABC transporter permease LptF